PHTALHHLRVGMMQHWTRYVVEVDVVSHFDSVNWEWLRKFVRHRVNDGGLIRLLNKWLKAGVMENGVVTLSSDGVPQGGPVSPSALEYLRAPVRARRYCSFVATVSW